VRKDFRKVEATARKTFIPTKVTELIIHFLEAVEIQSDKGERLRVALGAIQFLFKSLTEQAAIVEAGERIGDRVAFERF